MRLNISLLVLLNVFFVTSCLSLSSNETVIKKSTDPTPDWINKSGEVNVKNPNYINLVFKKGNLYNLPLGLKQSQAIISKQINYLVLSEVEKQLKKRLNNAHKKVNQTSLSYYVSQIVSKRSDSVKIEPLHAEKIYWEYRKQEKNHASQKYYVVWVLLLIPKTVYDNAILAIAHEFQNSKNDALVTLGNEIVLHPENLKD